MLAGFVGLVLDPAAEAVAGEKPVRRVQDRTEQRQDKQRRRQDRRDRVKENQREPDSEPSNSLNELGGPLVEVRRACQYDYRDCSAVPIGPGADLSGCSLCNADLSGKELNNANFRGAMLFNANLRA